VETIHRFKGLEADVCIVVIFEMDRPWDKALAYIGMSRARAQLYVMGPEAVRRSLEWSTD
jgi:ATP-dependent exoDNAse (exonuclease V) alpha subunit